MSTQFAETLKKLRTEKGLSQIQLGKLLFVNNSTIARWENGSRLPDATMMTRLARILGVEVGTLIAMSAKFDETPNVIIVDDNKISLSDCLAVLGDVMPNATITGFMWPLEAIEYAKTNPIALAVLDIELGIASGFDLCQTLLEINPRTNVVYLTAHPDYSLEAWDTEACGFMVKPLTQDGVCRQLKKLRYPITTGDTEI